MSQAPAAAIVTVEGAEFSLAKHQESQITDTAVVSFFALQKILSADGKISLSIANRCAIAGISLNRLAPPQKNTQLKRGEIRKQAKTLISSRFKDSGQTGYK